MEVKYIFLDIDGTLVAADGVIPESTKRAIRQARSKGHKVFICTGRSRCEIHENITCVEMDGIVGSAGAYLEIGGEIIYHRPMTETMLKRLLEYFEKKQMAILLETNDELLVNDIGLAYIEEHITFCKQQGKLYDKLLFDLAQPLAACEEPEKLAVNKLLYVTTKYEPEEIRGDLQQEFTVVDSAIQLPGKSGEISESGMNKGNGIRRILEYYGASLADAIGIGDGENDIEMLRTTGISIAMGNANPKLKEFADYVTTAVDKDGIWNAFQRYGLV